jgi:hydroxyacylglutathione hydrolase
MIRQKLLSQMDVFCYMIGDEATGACALIDPAFDTESILAEVRSAGLTVTHVINTHGHSDHSAGNAAILEATHARLYIHHLEAKSLAGMANSAFSRLMGGKGSPAPDILLKDKDLIDIGETQLTVIHTPGHTPGGICLHMPGHVFTGDTLFVGAVGRTDLPGGSMAKLLESIQTKLYTLPEETRVWPGHDYGESPYSTIGHEKRTNLFTR